MLLVFGQLLWEMREQDLSPAEVPAGLQSLCCANAERAEMRQVQEQSMALDYLCMDFKKKIKT